MKYDRYILKELNFDRYVLIMYFKLKYIFDRFSSEYGFMINKVGKYKAMSEWLSGLALDIEYYYSDIVDLAIKMGSIDPNPNDKLRNKVEQGYFDFMANIILGFEPKEVA